MDSRLHPYKKTCVIFQKKIVQTYVCMKKLPDLENTITMNQLKSTY